MPAPAVPLSAFGESNDRLSFLNRLFACTPMIAPSTYRVPDAMRRGARFPTRSGVLFS